MNDEESHPCHYCGTFFDRASCYSIAIKLDGFFDWTKLHFCPSCIDPCLDEDDKFARAESLRLDKIFSDRQTFISPGMA